MKSRKASGSRCQSSVSAQRVSIRRKWICPGLNAAPSVRLPTHSNQRTTVSRSTGALASHFSTSHSHAASARSIQRSTSSVIAGGVAAALRGSLRAIWRSTEASQARTSSSCRSLAEFDLLYASRMPGSSRALEIKGRFRAVSNRWTVVSTSTCSSRKAAPAVRRCSARMSRWR